MVLQKRHGASNQKYQILRRQATAVNPKPTATRKAPVKPTTTRPTPRPIPVKPTTITRATLPIPIIPTPSRPPPRLPPITKPTVLPPTTGNLPPTTSSSISATSAASSAISSATSSDTSSSIPVLPSTSVPSTPPIVAAITSTTPTPSTTAAAVASANTGALAGAIIGGCAALGLIAAGVFLFLRRRRQKKERYAEAFNTSDFRRSAVLLDEGREKQGNAQPLTRIERHVQNAPVPNASSHHPNYYTSTAAYYGGERAQYDDTFATQASYGTAYRGPYSAQPAYAYRPNVNPYAYPPQAHYPPQPQFVAQPQHYDAAPLSHYTHSETSLPYARRYDTAPSPAHYTQSETSSLRHPEPAAPSVTMAYDAASTVQCRHSTEDDGDAPPPAYEISDNFVNHKPDVKTRHLTYDAASSINGSGSVVTPAPAPVPVSTSTGLSAEPSSPLFSGASRHHTLSSRPVSGTSAFTIVYD